jgi:hypothetical protein
VLVMRYVPALPIGDRATLERRGIPLRDVLATLARAYAKQVFVDGLFHADPHPGNLLIDRPDAAVRPRVLFIDFGLSSTSTRSAPRDAASASTPCCAATSRASRRHGPHGNDRARRADGVRTAVAAMFERMAGEDRCWASAARECWR